MTKIEKAVTWAIGIANDESITDGDQITTALLW